MKIDKTNYFEASKGTFKMVPQSWHRVVDTTKLIKRLNSIFRSELGRSGDGEFYGIPERIKLGNHQYKLISVSLNTRYRCFSLYYVSEDEKYLFRLSDHWCGSNADQVKHLDKIARCTWVLAGKTRHASVTGNHPVQGGIVAFKDMTWA